MEDASVYNLPIDLLTNLPIKFSSIDTIYRASTFQTKNLKRKARKHNPKFKTTNPPILQFTDSPIDLVVNIGCKFSINGLFFTVYCILCYFHKSVVGVGFIRPELSG